MIYICKPKKISIYINSEKKSTAQVKAETGCTALINGGFFNMSNFQPVCHLKVDGKVLSKDPWKYWGFGWNTNELHMVNSYEDYENYIACVCLVRNGKAETLNYPSALGGYRPRTALGVFEDGRVWLYAETSPVRSPECLQKLALQLGLKHCLMLDGGGSTQGAMPTETINAGRKVHNYICVWEEETTMKKVVLDPGHGVETLGKCSPDKSYYEHEFNLDMAKRIKEHLARHGVAVTMTRTDEHETGKTESEALAARVAISNEVRPDLFLSIHSNAYGNGSEWTDPEGYGAYTSSAGENAGRNKAAKAILARVKEAGITLHGGGLHHNRFYVLRKTIDPAVLIEHGFHTNKKEVELLKSSAYRDKLAEADAKGILDYLGITWIPEIEKVFHRVQTGAFKEKKNAERQLAKVKKAGFDAIMVKVGDLYKIQIGAFTVYGNATAQLEKVRKAGFADAYTTTR